MLLVTWNVNSMRVRLPRVLELLEKHRPHALLMQETKVDPGAFPRVELDAAGYRVADHSGGRWAGVAIAARADLELADVRTGLAGEPDAGEARWIEATVAGDPPGQRVRAERPRGGIAHLRRQAPCSSRPWPGGRRSWRPGRR